MGVGPRGPDSFGGHWLVRVRRWTASHDHNEDRYQHAGRVSTGAVNSGAAERWWESASITLERWSGRTSFAAAGLVMTGAMGMLIVADGRRLTDHQFESAAIYVKIRDNQRSQTRAN
jgi:hypothetical protein